MTGRCLIAIGLAFNTVGTVLVGYVVQQGWIAKLMSDRTLLVPNTRSAKWANRIGWPMLILGYVLQLVGLWLP